jgi:hypothetical protein
MKCILALGLIVSFSIITFSQTSFAGDRCGTHKAGQAAFFKDSKYRGACVVRYVGRYSNSKRIGIGNDKISSIKVGSQTQVRLCRDNNFGGGCKTYTKSTPSLGRMNDKTSSAIIEKIGSSADRCGRLKVGQAAFYKDSKYRGACVVRKIGRYSNSKRIGIGNDKISSIKVGSRTQVRLCRDSNFRGGCKIYTRNTPSLGGLNDKTSSAIIEKLSPGGGGSLSPPDLKFEIAKNMKSRLEAMQWTMVAGSKGRSILSGNRYQLKNSISGRGLKRQKRTIAANLGWQIAKSKSFTVRIKRKKGNGQVRYGDVVALELKSYGWLRYKNQRRGINISDDNDIPRYIWIIRGGTNGTKLVSDMPFALYFTKYRTEMTYCKRTWGIDLGWYRKSKCGGWKANLSNRVFGANGLYSRDGLTGKAFAKLRDHLCEKAIAAAGAAIIAYTGSSAAPVVAAGAPYAIKECKKL